MRDVTQAKEAAEGRSRAGAPEGHQAGFQGVRSICGSDGAQHTGFRLKINFLILKRSQRIHGTADLFAVLDKLSKMAASNWRGICWPVMNASGTQPIRRNSSSPLDK